MPEIEAETTGRLRCKVCGAVIGLWGGLNGLKPYYKHHVSRKVRPPHKPVPEKQQ